MKNDSADFIATVKDLFSFLEEFGFVLSNIEENRLYAKVEFLAGKLAIVFSYDIKEQTMDCYIGKVANGVIVADRRRGGYWSSLFDYLVKEFKIINYFYEEANNLNSSFLFVLFQNY